MDYEVFLVSRMREHFVHTGRAREAVITGYAQSGRVVIAAAAIMIAVFAAFILDPSPITKSIGLSLAFGVLVDAFVVRLTLVPAVMTLLGKRAWGLPKRLERLVPDVDQRRGVLVDSVSGRQGAGGSPLPRRTQPAAADRSDTPLARRQPRAREPASA
jgi:uncharacterized membrane protein YdfJ with MMPL/SSD domain